MNIKTILIISALAAVTTFSYAGKCRLADTVHSDKACKCCNTELTNLLIAAIDRQTAAIDKLTEAVKKNKPKGVTQ